MSWILATNLYNNHKVFMQIKLLTHSFSLNCAASDKKHIDDTPLCAKYNKEGLKLNIERRFLFMTQCCGLKD